MRRLRARGRMRVAVASICIGMTLIAAGVVWMAPEYIMSAWYAGVSADVHISDDDKPSDAEAEAKAGTGAVTETERSAAGIDWNALKAANRETCGWINVGQKGIDFPVMHGVDNEYYLHHDMYGRWGYGGVFSDYRCDPNGRAVVIYGHTLIGGGMFTPLGRADEAGQLATIGPVVYSTPEAGAVTFTPVATLHVYPTFQDVQQFSWDVSQEQLEAACRAIAREKAQAGEWNVELARGEKPEGEALVDYFPSQDGEVTIVDDGLSEEVAVSRYYCATTLDGEAAHQRAEKAAWRDWLVNLCNQGTQLSADAQSQIATASRSLVLACCSWPFDNHRTLVVCVA